MAAEGTLGTDRETDGGDRGRSGVRRESDADLLLYRQLVESVRDYAIFALDAGGHVISWNAGAQRFKGYTRDEILGRHFSTFYPDEDRAAKKPEMELVVAAREGKYEEEGWRVRKDGTQFWAGVLITAIRGPDGQVTGYAKVTRDLTERRESQRRAMEDARRVAAAEASSRAKSEFLASMSHELRTPLNAIGGYAELLSMGVHGPVTPEQAQDLERITASQRHLLSIINDILNYSRIEAGRVAYERVPVPLDGAVADVLAMVQPQAERRGLRLAGPAGGERVVALADQVKVEQILLNLLSNAVKFTPEGGRITVACRVLLGRAAVVVADTGLGIPPDQLASIFEPFVQLGR
ncbi:MAG TPA: histidine kinase dimerization/phospho-acceptor domain-containing protein, partial [Longimicrobium sp.]|nr:histidine kinase dimerization/phospho-acceptor domain-containing protein [Longimicrobium sp.]